MRIEAIDLRFFRSHRHLVLTNLGRETWISGPNASGKTNLLEAIAYVGGVRLRPFARDRDLVQFGEPGFRIQARVRGRDGREADIEVRVEGRTRRFLREGKPVRPGSPGMPVLITFTPDDLDIVKGAPDQRRRILEQDIGGHSVPMRDIGARYLRIVKQRNALLSQVRDGLASPGSLVPWDAALCDLGGRLQALRAVALRDLAPVLDVSHRRVAMVESGADGTGVARDGSCGEGPVRTSRFEIRYRPSGSGGSVEDPDQGGRAETREGFTQEGEGRAGPALSELDLRKIHAEALQASVERVRSVEIARGHTLVGPHRDDLEFVLDGRDMRLYASQGQQRTAVIALKAAIVERVTEALEDPPVVLLDDVLSELDPFRQHRLRTLWQGVQTFVTTAEPVPSSMIAEGDEPPTMVRLRTTQEDQGLQSPRGGT